MYISDVVGSNREEIYDVIVQDLRQLGIKHRIKKTSSKHTQHMKNGCTEIRLFKVPLNHLELEAVVLSCGIVVEVPVFIVMACTCIREHIETEGIFRKAGSAARQRELKAFLDNGKKLGPDHHAIDVANILKLFFRELPEPLIPYVYHDLLLRCLLLKDKPVEEGLLLICLLIPTIHLNTLVYLMQFFLEVATYSSANKMDVRNLAIVITPSLMPVEEKVVVNTSSRLNHHVQVVELLIRNADKIGSLPENVSDKLLSHHSLSHDEQDDSRQSKKKKKRRSGSLTRMLNGLKKMVGKGTPEVDENHLITSTPDFSTPCVKSGKKRKAEVSSAFSTKKKKDVLQMLPQSVALATPYTPSRSMAHDLFISSPVCAHPNPLTKSKSPQSMVKIRHRRFFTPKLHGDSNGNKTALRDHDSCKKSRLSLGGRSAKKQKPEDLAPTCKPVDSSHVECGSQEGSPGRGWSTEPWGRKKYLNLSDVPVYSPSIGTGVDISGDEEIPRVENSAGNTFFQETHFNLSNNIIHVSEPSGSESMESEFVRIPKSEYEAIKNRVSAIENRISQEFGNITGNHENNSNSVDSVDLPCSKESSNSNAELVQCAYERTLEESGKLDDGSADQLARRLSKELRIRRSLENKIIRSPSARKIGTIRRRSRENTKPLLKKQAERSEVARNMSWHLAIRPSVSQINQLYPRSSLRRGRPNTVFSGLPQPNARNFSNEDNNRITLEYQHGHNTEVGGKTEKYKFSSDDINNESSSGMNVSDPSHYIVLCRDSFGPLTRSKARRASSFHGSDWAFHNQNFVSDCLTEVKKTNSDGDITQTAVQTSLRSGENKKKVNKQKEEEQWQAAESFFNGKKDLKQEAPPTGRASIAKLRSQNAGLVMERLKMFDSKVNSKTGLKEKHASETKKPVLVPGVFARNGNLTHSVRLHYSRNTPTKRQGISKSHHNQSSHKVYSSVKTKADSMCETYKDSPKKIGTPRRKQNEKSPGSSCRRQKLKLMKSPKVDPSYSSPATTLCRKHNSLKLARDKVCANVRANLTAPDVWLATEKENVLSPADNAFLKSNVRSQKGRELNEERQISSQTTVPNIVKEICSPSVDKLGISPLKDSNRIRVNGHIVSVSNKEVPMEVCSGLRTPRESPYIKKALLTKSPSQFGKTPRKHLLVDRSERSYITPMKALPGFTSVETPKASPKRQSPRLIVLKTRNIP